ncbi:hypothetical protein [Candidatus Tisiphia endosymbiont of Nemotelus uliginosus]|uniref:hypothetical protein n=1 Tax=Candidatus Tisiphia endosymbiont of Nemotelus uliginosus TaxID=3077926 RepID=UPI0035CB9697
MKGKKFFTRRLVSTNSGVSLNIVLATEPTNATAELSQNARRQLKPRKLTSDATSKAAAPLRQQKLLDTYIFKL